MNTAEWIIVAILSTTLFIFLVVGIIFLVKLIGLINKAREVTETAQSVVANADGVVENVRRMTCTASIANVARMIFSRYNEAKASKKERKENE